MNRTTLTDTDAYKLSHHGFMSPKTEYIYSNMTPRDSKYLGVPSDLYEGKSVFFGLQYFIKEYLIEEWNNLFFKRDKKEVLERFARRVNNYLGAGAVDFSKFGDLHDLGYLPIKIKALPEGSLVNEKVPYFTIINTDPRFPWLTNYLETVISCELWKPSVVATRMYYFRKLINKYAMETTGSTDGTDFQLHGFEFRGMSGRHDAAICGAAYLLNSLGTDTIPAIDLIEDYYNGNSDIEPIAFSVPASEHSVSSLGSAVDSELEFFRAAITTHYPTGIVSLVADTYDFWRVISEYSVALKDDILNRVPNAMGLSKVVWRPDSGNPIYVISGFKVQELNVDYTDTTNIFNVVNADTEAVQLPNGKYYTLKRPKLDSVYLDREICEAEAKGAIEVLWSIFGGTTNSLGYRVLHERIGLIYGDSITMDNAKIILERLRQNNFASTNVVFGVGSYFSQLCTRDTLGIAVKATWAQVDGIGYDIFKDPATDLTKMKKSARGLLRVDQVTENGISNYVLFDQCSLEDEGRGCLDVVFENGVLIVDEKYSDIRNRLYSK